MHTGKFKLWILFVPGVGSGSPTTLRVGSGADFRFLRVCRQLQRGVQALHEDRTKLQRTLELSLIHI